MRTMHQAPLRFACMNLFNSHITTVTNVICILDENIKDRALASKNVQLQGPHS
jgi:hypothetical protein